MKTSEVLYGAADRIEERGWWHRGGTSLGTCAANAITDTQGTVYRHDAYDALASHIGGSCIGDIFAWNDAPDRTAAEVIETLRACAVIEAAREEQDAAAWETYAVAVSA